MFVFDQDIDNARAPGGIKRLIQINSFSNRTTGQKESQK